MAWTLVQPDTRKFWQIYGTKSKERVYKCHAGPAALARDNIAERRERHTRRNLDDNGR